MTTPPNWHLLSLFVQQAESAGGPDRLRQIAEGRLTLKVAEWSDEQREAGAVRIRELARERLEAIDLKRPARLGTLLSRLFHG